ncbi:hypothetical protein [Pontibacter actiniarum]|uniref:Uncharacterized protein n=1 Tax=Pontibacter actiniarum TaxID=323450 RepID=A0A1X9YPT6_9BACT|nr:hypothetical protein [Pontibacter actiniarum]ARS34893.1 hypothetical protein CA264_05255 [Pontibacter actiniarum]
MDDFKIILYILAAAAYFLFMQWRKAFKGDEGDVDVEPRRPHPRRQQPERPVTSFEDILRELQPKAERGKELVQEAKERGREKAQQVVPPLAPVAEAPAKKYKSYEDVAPRVLSWEKPAEAREAAKQSRLQPKSEFEAYEKERVLEQNKYARLLRNPASARDAVILAEIINRKYS